MNKVIVIGCPGAGKSTFARELQSRTGLPLYHLDMIWHKPDKTTVTKEKFDGELAKLLSFDRWIIDGNYQRTLEVRMIVCDTVFLLDFPVEVCLDGVSSRLNKPRADIPWIETEKDPEFIEWISKFSQNQLPQIYELLKKHQDKFEITVFHSRQEIVDYLAAWDEK